MTLSQIVFRIINFVESGRSTNEDNTSFRQVAFDVHQMRSLLVRREEQTLSFDEFYQNLTLNLSDFSTIDSPDSHFENMIVQNLSTVLRSDSKIYPLINLKYNNSYKVESDTFNLIDVVDSNAFRFSVYNRFSGNTIKSTVKDGYVYILIPSNASAWNDELIGYKDIDDQIEEPETPTSVEFYGLFENPEDIDSFDPDGEYPASNQLTSRIIESLIKRYYNEERNVGDTITNLEEDDELASK